MKYVVISEVRNLEGVLLGYRPVYVYDDKGRADKFCEDMDKQVNLGKLFTHHYVVAQCPTGDIVDLTDSTERLEPYPAKE